MRAPRTVMLLALLAAACSRSEPELAPLPTLPFVLDSARVSALAEGVTHRFLYTSEGPWAIHLLDVSLDRCITARTVKGFPGAEGRELTSVLLRRLADTMPVLGGVNADFFRYDPPGVPTNAMVIDGRVITPPTQYPVLAIDSIGVAWIGTLDVIDSSAVGLTLGPLHPLHAVGGRPVIVRDGAPTAEALDTVPFAVTRHPRTAAGIAAGGGRLLLVTVDGRQPGWSVGMRLDELARLMAALGADHAVNLDGGGSTAMVVRDSTGAALLVANRPSDREGERAVGNALAVVDRCRAKSP